MIAISAHTKVYLAKDATDMRRSFRGLILLTEAVATLIAVFGIFMTPLGWGWALFVWGYALVWFLVNDRVKLLAYRIFDPTKEPLLAKRPRDLTPQIAARAYELYEQRARGEGQATRDWLQAERETRRDESEP